MTIWSFVQIVLSCSVSGLLLAGVVMMVWWFDRYDREPLGLVAIVFGWGAVGVATLSTAVGRQLVEAVVARLGEGAGSILAAVTLPVLLEEVLKAAGVVAVALLSAKVDTPTDGLVYGTAAGLGFGLAENLMAGSAAAVGGATVVLSRTVATALVHGLATGAFGALLGLGYLSRSRLRRFGWFVSGLGAAVCVRGIWTLTLESREATPLLVWVIAAAALPLLWLGMLQLILVGERRILARELAEEVRLGVLPGWVAEVLPSYWRRVQSDWWPDRSERTVIARLLTRLAFRKHAIGGLPASETALAGLEVVSLRRRARRTLGLEDARSFD